MPALVGNGHRRTEQAAAGHSAGEGEAGCRVAGVVEGIGRVVEVVVVGSHHAEEGTAGVEADNHLAGGGIDLGVEGTAGHSPEVVVLQKKKKKKGYMSVMHVFWQCVVSIHLLLTAITLATVSLLVAHFLFFCKACLDWGEG